MFIEGVDAVIVSGQVIRSELVLAFEMITVIAIHDRLSETVEVGTEAVRDAFGSGGHEDGEGGSTRQGRHLLAS